MRFVLRRCSWLWLPQRVCGGLRIPVWARVRRDDHDQTALTPPRSRRDIDRGLGSALAVRDIRARSAPTSMTPSVPKIIGALTWPIWAMRNARPDRSPMPVPSTTPHFSLQ